MNSTKSAALRTRHRHNRRNTNGAGAIGQGRATNMHGATRRKVSLCAR